MKKPGFSTARAKPFKLGPFTTVASVKEALSLTSPALKATVAAATPLSLSVSYLPFNDAFISRETKKDGARDTRRLFICFRAYILDVSLFLGRRSLAWLSWLPTISGAKVVVWVLGRGPCGQSSDCLLCRGDASPLQFMSATSLFNHFFFSELSLKKNFFFKALRKLTSNISNLSHSLFH